MKTFNVKKETPILRCEICHQMGEFNSTTGRCDRCSSMTLPMDTIVELSKQTTDNLPVKPDKYFVDKYSRLWNKIGAISFSVFFLSVIIFDVWFFYSFNNFPVRLLPWIVSFFCLVPIFFIIFFDRCPKCQKRFPLVYRSSKHCSSCNIRLR